MACWVYFLRDDETGLIKIGHTGDLRPRQRAIQYEIGRPLRFVGTLRVEGGLREEGLLHNLFRAHHSHGEWFRSCPEIDRVIAAINAGSFDIRALKDESSWLRRKQAREAWVVRRANEARRSSQGRAA